MRSNFTISSQFSRLVPSKKNIVFMIIVAAFVYVIGIPISSLFICYYRGDFVMKALVISLENSDKIYADFCIPQLKMVGGLTTEGTIVFDFGNDLIELKIPKQKWDHLEMFHFRNYIRVKLHSKGERSPNFLNERPKQVLVTVKIKIKHKLKISYVYNHLIYLDFNKGEGNKEAITIDSVEKEDDGNNLNLKIKATKNVLPFLQLKLENLDLNFLAHGTGMLCDFSISASENDLLINCSINNDNIPVIKKLLNKLEEESENKFFYFKRKKDFSDQPLNNFVILLIEAFELCIYKNKESLGNKIKEGIKFKFTETSGNQNFLSGSISVYKDILPHYIIYQLLSKVSFGPLPLNATISDIKILSGEIYTETHEENYFVLHFVIEVIELEDLIFNLIKPSENNLIIKTEQNTNSVFNSFLSILSVVYDLRSNVSITSTGKLRKVAKKETKNNGLAGNPLRIETIIDDNQRIIHLRTKINSENKGERIIVFQVENDISWSVGYSMDLFISKGEIFIDTGVPMNQAISLSKQIKINLKSNEYKVNKLIKEVLYRINLSESNEPKKEFTENFESIFVNFKSIISIFKYEFKLRIKGKKIKNPIVNWSIKKARSLKFNARFDVKNKGNYFYLNFEWIYKVKSPKATTMVIEIIKPEIKFEFSEDDCSLFSEETNNIVIFDISKGDFFSLPCEINFYGSDDTDALSSCLVRLINRYQFASGKLLKKIKKEKNVYPVVKTFSDNKMYFTGVVKALINEKGTDNSGIAGKFNLFYESDGSFAADKLEKKLIKDIKNDLDNILTGNETKNSASYSIKFVHAPFELKPLELQIGNSYLRVESAFLEPTLLRNNNHQGTLDLNVSFYINFDEFLDNGFPDLKINGYYGDEHFEVDYNKKLYYKAKEYFFDDESGMIDILAEDFFIKKVSYGKPSSDKVNDVNNNEVVGLNNSLTMEYRGCLLKEFQKLARIIRRINFVSYPKQMNTHFELIIDSNGNLINSWLKVLCPLDYSKESMKYLDIKLINHFNNDNPMVLTLVHFKLLRSLLRYNDRFNGCMWGVGFGFIRFVAVKFYRFVNYFNYWKDRGVKKTINLSLLSRLMKAFPGLDIRLFGVSSDNGSRSLLFSRNSYKIVVTYHILVSFLKSDYFYVIEISYNETPFFSKNILFSDDFRFCLFEIFKTIF